MPLEKERNRYGKAYQILGAGQAVRMNAGNDREEEVSSTVKKRKRLRYFFSCSKSFEPTLNMSHDQC
jgi:hypothetical protein